MNRLSQARIAGLAVAAAAAVAIIVIPHGDDDYDPYTPAGRRELQKERLKRAQESARRLTRDLAVPGGVRVPAGGITLTQPAGWSPAAGRSSFPGSDYQALFDMAPADASGQGTFIQFGSGARLGFLPEDASGLARTLVGGATGRRALCRKVAPGGWSGMRTALIAPRRFPGIVAAGCRYRGTPRKLGERATQTRALIVQGDDVQVVLTQAGPGDEAAVEQAREQIMENLSIPPRVAAD